MSARFLVLNYFNDRQYPAHVLSATEASADVWKVGAGRRSPGHYYTSVTPNTAIRLVVDCGVSKGVDMLVLDRVGIDSIDGVSLSYQTSPDNSAWTTRVSFTAPTSASADNTALASGARTPEGAYVRYLGQTWSERYHGLLIPVLGAGIRPKVGGLWLGPSWVPPHLERPSDEDQHRLLAETTETPWGWSGSTLAVPQRHGDVMIPLLSESDYLTADLHVRDQYGRRPMWLVFDDAKAERAFLARLPRGATVQCGYDADYPWRILRFGYEEHDPLIDEGAAA